MRERECVAVPMNCEICRGACCEYLEIRIGGSPDQQRWLGLHGTPSRYGTALDCRCGELSTDGRCQIYLSRPSVCHDYPVGGAACVASVRRQRTAAQYADIRDETDPTVQALYAPKA